MFEQYSYSLLFWVVLTLILKVLKTKSDSRPVHCLYCSHTTANKILSVFTVTPGVVSHIQHDLILKKKILSNPM